jgi:hypothetical protein
MILATQALKEMSNLKLSRYHIIKSPTNNWKCHNKTTSASQDFQRRFKLIVRKICVSSVNTRSRNWSSYYVPQPESLLFVILATAIKQKQKKLLYLLLRTFALKVRIENGGTDVAAGTKYALRCKIMETSDSKTANRCSIIGLCDYRAHDHLCYEIYKSD